MYQECFVVMLVAYVLALLYKWSVRRAKELHPASSHTYNFRVFQAKFLIVYLLAMAADWVQGPYVYRLYHFYGFDRQANGILFIAGFGSSLLFGTWSGPFADKWGRRKACLLYCVIYALGCATKHFNYFAVLMMGRVLSGIATSLLYSVFESWMISEHQARGFDPLWMGSTFSFMSTGNGLVAVASGLVAQWAADAFNHPVAPFDVGAVLLIICFVMVLLQWTESYMCTETGFWSQMRRAVATVRDDARIALTGVQQSLFESAMYAFIFLWTPSLEDAGDVPHGIVFACFMVAVSLGGMLFFSMSVERIVRWMPLLYLLSAVTMLVPSFSNSALHKMVALTVFEVIVGFFWPCMATLRAAYIPEECRTSVMNVFRAPLNGIVCFILLYSGKLSLQTMFLICALLHTAAALSAVMLGLKVKVMHK